MNLIEPRTNGTLTALEPARALTPMEILSSAVERGADVLVLEKLLGLQERWEHNQARKAFDEAMSAARAEIPTITKSREVDFTTAKGRTNYRYEDLASIADAVKPVLARHGLSYRFRTSSKPNEPVTVTCIVSHRLGYSEENTLSAARDESGNKNSIQAIGSAVTYLQRYTLKAALGLAVSNDDDGQAAGGASQTPDQPRQQRSNPQSSSQLKKNGAWESFTDKVQHFRDARDLDGLKAWFTSDEVSARVAAWPAQWRDSAQEAFDAAHDWIEANP